MIHGSGSWSLDPVLRIYTFLGGQADPLISYEGRSAYFGAQNGALLWRADPSFENSVTGSGSIAKCSNILLGPCYKTFYCRNFRIFIIS
jgi:hypothetical protein